MLPGKVFLAQPKPTLSSAELMRCEWYWNILAHVTGQKCCQRGLLTKRERCQSLYIKKGPHYYSFTTSTWNVCVTDLWDALTQSDAKQAGSGNVRRDIDWHTRTSNSSGHSSFFVDLALSVATNTMTNTYMFLNSLNNTDMLSFMEGQKANSNLRPPICAVEWVKFWMVNTEKGKTKLE